MVVISSRKSGVKSKPCGTKLIYIIVLVLVVVIPMTALYLYVLIDNNNYSEPSVPLLQEIAAENPNTNYLDFKALSRSERKQALAEVMPYLENFVAVLNKTEQDQWVSQNKCQIELFGSEWGAHQLCHLETPPVNCTFLSFGISKDYSFDTQLADQWHCRGFAADPTVVHKSQLHDLVTFHNIAAKTLTLNKEARDSKRPWWVASVPSVKRFLDVKHITVLKMDCEGCEFSIARDIVNEDPNFFQHVDQFTFEAHLNKNWLDSKEALYYFALLFKLLHEAGLEIMGTNIGGCGSLDDKGYIRELIEIGYPNHWGRRPVGRRSCHEYLFARNPSKVAPKW
mmetsp:Transcript_8360/g.12128  ORF Transcript_8360/g.12128 Transcript_8360/m.12128 type:complete len:339 (-) Transcript_8360:1615-2631(-)